MKKTLDEGGWWIRKSDQGWKAKIVAICEKHEKVGSIGWKDGLCLGWSIHDVGFFLAMYLPCEDPGWDRGGDELTRMIVLCRDATCQPN